MVKANFILPAKNIFIHRRITLYVEADSSSLRFAKRARGRSKFLLEVGGSKGWIGAIRDGLQLEHHKLNKTIGGLS